MKNNRSLFILGVVSLLFLTIACKFSLSPIEGSKELGDGEIALTNQVKLQTSVAQTVEVMKPSEVPEDPGPAKEESAPAGLVAGTPLPCNKPKFQGETIPDNSEFDPGDSFTKTWTVLNDGTCSWTTNYLAHQQLIDQCYQ